MQRSLVGPICLLLAASFGAIVGCGREHDRYGSPTGSDGTGPICPAGANGTAGAGPHGTGGAGAAAPAPGGCIHTPPRLPLPDYNLAAATAPDGRIYLVLSRDRSGACAVPSLFVYAPADGSYRQLASAPAKLGTGRLSAVYAGGKLVVHSFEPWIYDPVTDVWTIGVGSPSLAYNRAAAPGDDGKAYFFGGYAQLEPTAAADAYDPATDSWTSLPPMPTADGQVMATRVGGLIYVVGASLAAFDQTAARWTTLAAPTTPRWNPGVVDDGAGRLLLMGGTDVGGNKVLESVESFDPTSGSWSPRARMRKPTQGTAVAPGCGGRLFAFGGASFTTPYDHVQIYGPGDSWNVSP